MNHDDLMFTSIESEDFLVNEEKPSLSSSWSSIGDKDNQWKSTDSNISQLQSPMKQSDLLACSTPVKCESNNNTKFHTCPASPMDGNSRSLSGVNINKILQIAQDGWSGVPPTSHLKTKRSLSLHDLDNIFEFPSNKLAINADSRRISHSLSSSKTRSKDSGIHRTASCVSLLSNNASSRKYDHVQSKVKQYIQSMKELSGKNHPSKNTVKPCILNYSDSKPSLETIESVKEKFHGLQNEVLEKDLLISTYHEKYVSLQMKYAHLKRKYDALRFGNLLYNESLSPDQFHHSDDSIKTDSDDRLFQSCNVFTSDSKSPHFDTSDLGPHHQSNQSCNHSTSVSPADTKLLNPISKIHSTSLNLSRQYVPLQPSPLKESSSLALPLAIQSLSKSDSSSHLASQGISGLKEDDPFLKVQQWQESLSPSKVSTCAPGSPTAPTLNCHEKRSKLKGSKPLRRSRKIKQGGEVPDVLRNLTKENRPTSEDLREVDTCPRLLPTQAENSFKPAYNLDDSLSSSQKSDMLPFTSSFMENNFNVKKYHATKSSVSHAKNSMLKRKFSQSAPISAKSNPCTATTTFEKCNQTALCCSLKASDLYINQLNKGLDKLMIALTELGTSTAHRS
nr:PREDICTED: uncharacterized protein LOC109035139 [Bemisia tabaci]